ncbi:helicase-exonuclease AddAB subunit AddA [Companilactobacillus furfuricola]|uniref:helicase-exonuclease AddAB subunit AddA n=1 Tax=Companilactobacillus furfuricola TaxID=1462575 RepID=UPI000F76ED0D|nr:helicase-exonuclease AddAB subunit AddA [Companilactobacillus furfuricola]
MPKWTENQQKAIFHHGHDILVSAAAGSGKTTILIERIIELIKNGENVDNLLVATFTDAAAKEMKDRLINRIKELVASDSLSDEQQQHMQSQIFKVPVANISTLHAFCLSVIKKYYYVIDLDPNFRLLSDDTERTLLQEQAFDNVRNKYYNKADLEFLDLTENFSNDKTDDGLADTVYRLYNFAVTNENTDLWLDKLADSYQIGDDLVSSDFYQTKVKKQLLNNLNNMISEMESLAEISANDLLSQNYVVVFNNAIAKIKVIQDAIINDAKFDEVRDMVANFKFDRVKAVSKEIKAMADDETIVESVKDQRKKLKTEMDEKIYEGYFIQDEENTIKTIHNAQRLVKKLVEVEEAFIKEFTKLKDQGHTLDFNDLEHKAIEIFNTEVDGQKVALDFYQSRFHEIMIDEYQDVNPMQEQIIQTLSNDDNHMFMVGDIKQSIYGFRQAAPYIFTSKYQRFQQDDNPDELIQLSKNFRSSVAVDDFVNAIFKRILDRKIGDIDYDRSVQLIPGTNFPDDVDSTNEVYILNPKGPEENDEKKTEIEVMDPAVVDKRVDKIEFAAKRIKQMMSENFQVYDAKKSSYRDLKYSDIAILMRNKNSNTDLISYFANEEIPVMVTDAQNYFQTTELQIIMSMLNIIDNPRQDVPLVAVLRSPIVGLDEQELALIRLANKRVDYYSAILDFIQQPDSDQRLVSKMVSFIERLEGYRDFSNKNSLVKLIWKVYQETGILEYVSGMPGGKQRAANLHALYQRANTYEKNNFMGLHKFISFIQRMQDMDRDLAQPNSIETTDDSVKVMTIHASKGLEFPVVILLNIDDKFNNKDYIADTLYDVHQGIGISVLDQVSRANARTIQRTLISNDKKISTVSEEMRLLYVALTRAKQKLVLVGYDKDPQKMINNWEYVRKDDNGVINEGFRLAASSYQNLIGMSLISDDKTQNDLDLEHFTNDESQMQLTIVDTHQLKELEPNKATASDVSDSKISDRFKTTVDNILDFQYPHEDAVNTTAYQSVSEIKGLFSDPDDEQMAPAEIVSRGRYTQKQFKRPQFLAQEKKVSATDIGSATHLVLQKIPIEQTPGKSEFEALLEQLVNTKVLDEQVAQKIDLDSLVSFYQSDLGQMIISNHKQVLREYPFSILAPAEKLFNSAKDIDTSDDKILVHGIIDGVIELDDEIKIFDYKTDNVNTNNIDEKINNYSGQLNLYAKAISIIKNKPVTGKYLYFLKINQIEKLD